MATPGPSPRAHLYRLAILLALFAAAFLIIKSWATPEGWDHENWFRRGALELTASQPLIYGGNESCQECHADAQKQIGRTRHAGLSCESCHGPLADHIGGGKKVAAALVDKSRAPCENCHDEQINRPEGFPQFSKTGDIGKEVRKHAELDDTEACLRCHDAHDPRP